MVGSEPVGTVTCWVESMNTCCWLLRNSGNYLGMIPDIKAMTMEEKLLTMRNIWEDLRENLEASVESKEICDLRLS